MKDMADGTPTAMILQDDMQQKAVYAAQQIPVVLSTVPQRQAQR